MGQFWPQTDQRSTFTLWQAAKTKCRAWSWFMLESTEHVIYHAHYVKMPTIVGILIFITIIITTSESLEETSNFICYFLFKFSCPVEFLKKKNNLQAWSGSKLFATKNQTTEIGKHSRRAVWSGTIFFVLCSLKGNSRRLSYRTWLNDITLFLLATSHQYLHCLLKLVYGFQYKRKNSAFIMGLSHQVIASW